MIITMTQTGKVNDWQLFAMVFSGLVGYELISGSGSHAIDNLDLIATVVFTLLSAFFLSGLEA